MDHERGPRSPSKGPLLNPVERRILSGEVLWMPSGAVLAVSRESHTEELASGPLAEYRSFPRTDKQEVGQINQHEQDREPADDSQDDHYHHQLP